MNIQNTSTRLKEIMEERNLRQVDLLEIVKPFCELYNVKINKSDLSQYVSGKVKPGQEKLSMLGMALGINETWLMGYNVPKEKQFDIDKSTLTNHEKQLLNNFSKLDNEDKNKVMDYTNLLTLQDKYNKEDNIITIPKKEKQAYEEEMDYLVPVAAHNDNLTDEEKRNMNTKISKALKKLNK